MNGNFLVDWYPRDYSGVSRSHSLCHSENPLNHLVWYIFFAGLAAHASLISLHFTRMWSAEHFQFFPVALIATGVLTFSRRADIVRDATLPRSIAVWIGLVIVLLTILVAALLGLALTGWLSFLGFIALMIYASYGAGGLRASLPIFVMLAIIKPLPTSMEQQLTIGMQKIASHFAGTLLNNMGVMHYQQGVVLILVGKSFMAEEACSGIRSLFSSIAAVVFLGLMNRYHWLRHILNILQTIGWVIVYNAFRIATVVYVEERFNFSIAEGWKHELFGFVIFFVIFATVLSTDRLFASVILPKAYEAPEDPAGMPSRWSDWLAWPGSYRSGIGIAFVFGLISILSVRMLFLVPDYKEGFAQRLAAAEEEYLPKDVAGWKVAQFYPVHRPEQHLQGSDSYIWEVKKGDSTALISLDGSFNDFHDLSWCYTALGWDCISNRNYSTIEKRANGAQDANSELTLLNLKKASGETGIVYFSAVDKRGDIVVPPPVLGQEVGEFVLYSVINGLRFAFGLQTQEELRSTTYVAPVSTIQLVYMPTEPIKEAELIELKQLFLFVREALRKSPRFDRG